MNVKVLLVSLLSSLMLFVNQSLAAPIGNPAKVFKGEEKVFSVGYEGDFVFDRDLEDDSEIETNSHTARIGYTLKDMAEAYVVLGAIDGKIKGNEAGTDYEVESSQGFLWGIGGTLPIHEFENGVRVGAAGKYRRSNPDIDKVSVGEVSVALSDSDLVYQDWVVALGAAYPLEWGAPYIGVKYSDVSLSDFTIAGTTIDDDLQSDNVVGIFVGLDLNVKESVKLNVEGRFIDETALTVQADIKF